MNAQLKPSSRFRDWPLNLFENDVNALVLTQSLLLLCIQIIGLFDNCKTGDCLFYFAPFNEALSSLTSRKIKSDFFVEYKAAPVVITLIHLGFFQTVSPDNWHEFLTISNTC